MQSLVQRVANLEGLLVDLLEAHNALDERHELLFYKLQYVMDHVRVRRAMPTSLLDTTGKPQVEEGMLTSFWARDGQSYIAALQEQAHVLEKQIAGRKAVVEAARDTLTDLGTTAGDAGPGDPPSEVPAGPRLVASQA